MDDTRSGRGDDAQLKNLSLEDLGKVEVTSVSKQPEQVWKTPAAIFVLSQEDIRRSGATNIPELLRLVPGVEVAQVDSDHWSIAIRGFAGTFSRSLLVLIDGRSVYTPLFSGVYWDVQNLLLEDVERIEVIRGPGGTIWGSNAVNGVINIITKAASSTQGALVTLGGGNVNQGTGGARYGGTLGKDFAYRIYAMGFVNGPQRHADGDGFDDWRIGQMGFRTDWKKSDRDSLTVQGDLYRGETGERVSITTFTPPAGLQKDDNAFVSGGNIVVRWAHQRREGSDFQLEAYFDRTIFQDLQYGETRSTFDVDFIDHERVHTNHAFTWGAGARVSPANFMQSSAAVDFLPHKQTATIYSGFAQYELPLVRDKLMLTAGTKLEHNSFSGFEYQPTARLLWALTNQQSFWAAVTRAVRTPSRVDRDLLASVFATATPPPPLYVLLAGDPSFAAEKLQGYEAGYRTTLTKHFYLDVTGFYNIYHDLENLGPTSTFVTSTPAPLHAVILFPIANGVRGHTIGGEVAPEWQITQHWRVRGSYSYLHMSLRDDPGFTDVGMQVVSYMGSSPRHSAVFQSHFDLPSRLELDGTFRFASALPAQKVDSYETADLRLGWRAGERVEFSVLGQNLFQPAHPEFGGNPTSNIGIKRGVYAKLVWRK